MTRTSEVSPIFAFSLTKGSAPAVKSNLPTSGNGFLSISTAIEVVPGTLLVISIGTTAPFSAICGASISTSLLGRGLPAPSAFSASAAVFAPKPSLFQVAASAANGFRQAAARTATRLLRIGFIRISLEVGILSPPTAEYPRFASAFLLEPQLVQRHPAVDGLHHVVDREQARRGGGERLHLDPGPAAAFDPRDHDHGRGALLQLEVDGDPRDGNGVSEGNQVGSAFGRLDRRYPRHAQRVALPGLARRDQAECRRAHRDTARGDGDAMRARLGSDVDHVRGTTGVEMCQLSVRFSGHAGRYHKHMRATAWLIAACVALAPRAFAQNLPDLGSAGDSVLSPQMERRLGESIVRDIRFREPAYIDDPEISEYLGNLGAQLTQVTAGARHDFEFFALRDPAINAFALPGGFVGVHTGLINAADTESELASVLAHEISHVTQRHIARMIGQQQQMQIPVMAAIAAAILLGRSRPDLASGAAAAAQAGAVQAQLSYSRDFEREADRVGLQALNAAGFDARAMAVFFEKMQRSARVSDDGSIPGYLRTHPVTTERIADAQNGAASMPYRQHLDSQEFQLVRAKLRADAGEARDAVEHFESSIREQRYASEAAAHYGLASALLRARRAREADAEVRRLRGAGGSDPMIETLAARVKQALGEPAAAAALLADARARYPYSNPVLYAYAAALQDTGRNAEALAMLAEPLRLARSAGDGDFYQLSVVDARLKDLRAQYSLEMRDAKR